MQAIAKPATTNTAPSNFSLKFPPRQPLLAVSAHRLWFVGIFLGCWFLVEWRAVACDRRMRHGLMVSRRSCATLVARYDEGASLNKSAMPHTPITGRGGRGKFQPRRANKAGGGYCGRTKIFTLANRPRLGGIRSSDFVRESIVSCATSVAHFMTKELMSGCEYRPAVAAPTPTK
jgi:hypothetical protein